MTSTKAPKAAKLNTSPPWERSGLARRFGGHRVAFDGKFARLRKKEVSEVLVAEGASLSDKLDGKTTLFVFATAGSGNHKRAEKLMAGGADLTLVGEEEFRRRYLLPTAEQAIEMLGDKSGRARLANLLEQNREPYSRGTDESSEIVLKGVSFRGADMSGASLPGILFRGCDLRDARLSNVKWLAEAQGSDFRGAKADKIELVEIKECDLREATLDQASLRDLTGCQFEGASLKKASFSGDVSKCHFGGATLDVARASYAKLSGCTFDKASLPALSLEAVTLEGCSFVGADLRGAKLSGDDDTLVLVDCDLRRADMRKATLSHVRFERCKLDGALFDGAKLIEVDFADTDTGGAKGLPTAGGSNGAKGRARQVVDEAAPTFKKVEVRVTLRIGRKDVECLLYQFDHGANSSCLQAWLDGKDVGSLHIGDAITTIAKLSPKAKLDEKSLVVKSSKGKVTPKLRPKELETAILEAWREALAG